MWGKDLSHFKDFHFDIAEAFSRNAAWTQRQGNRGYKFFVEGYIHDVFTHESEPVITGKCYRSQKKNLNPHSLHLKFFRSIVALELVEAHCTCEAGNSQSSNHVVGLAYYLQHLIYNGAQHISGTVSSTSLPMQWNKPRGDQIIPQQLPGSVFCDPTNVNRLKDPIVCKIRLSKRNEDFTGITKENVIALRERLHNINPSIPLASTLSTETMDDGKLILLSDGVHVPAHSFLGHMARAKRNKVEHEEQHLRELPITLPLEDNEMVNILISMVPVHHVSLEELTMQQAAEVERRTMQQNQSDLWRSLRKYRFTASKFDFVCKRKLFNAELLRQFVEPRDIGHVEAVGHGVKNEPIAREAFLQANTHIEFFKCGLVIHPYSLHLGASPDGVLIDTTTETYGVLEIKCPCSSKSENLDQYARVKNFCMTKDENNTWSLKRRHEYYYQVQGQMLISGLRWAEFVIYIVKSKEMVHERIAFDPTFCKEMYEKLTTVCENQIRETVLVVCS